MTKNRANTIKGCLSIFFGLAMLVLGIAWGIYQPYHEKETFNKYRKEGTPAATYWDAVFSNLRINSSK